MKTNRKLLSDDQAQRVLNKTVRGPHIQKEPVLADVVAEQVQNIALTKQLAIDVSKAERDDIDQRVNTKRDAKVAARIEKAAGRASENPPTVETANKVKRLWPHKLLFALGASLLVLGGLALAAIIVLKLATLPTWGIAVAAIVGAVALAILIRGAYKWYKTSKHNDKLHAADLASLTPKPPTPLSSRSNSPTRTEETGSSDGSARVKKRRSKPEKPTS